MAREYIAVSIEQSPLTLDEVIVSCRVTREWVVEHVHAGVLLSETPQPPEQWRFSSRDLARVRRILELESRFDANPELAGLVADLFDELERLRARVRRAEEE